VLNNMVIRDYMVDVRELAQKAIAFKDKGLSEREIADELHVSVDTVKYLLEEGLESTLPPTDIKIGWRSLGVFGSRIAMMSAILTDIILEELDKQDTDVDVILGISLNGVPFSTYISDALEAELSVYKPPAERGKKGGSFSANYASVKGKKVIIVDDVVTTGGPAQEAVKDVKEAGGEPILVVVIVNKSSLNEISGVPLRALIRARSMGGTILGGGPLHSFPYG